MSITGNVRRMTHITVFVYGKPAWEMDLENQDVDERMIQALENLGIELKERLHYISRMRKLMVDNGWTGEGGLYDISFYKDCSVEEAKTELKTLGIDPRGMDIEEEERPVDDGF